MATIERLQESRLTLAILSRGSPDMRAPLVEPAGLSTVLTENPSVDPPHLSAPIHD